jgi:hypothetical protein
MPTSAAIAKPNVIARKLDIIQEKGALRSVDVANVIDVRQETVSRWRQGKAFPQREKEKLLMELEWIVEQLSEFYSPPEARMWLYSRQKILDGSVPAELIQARRTEEVIQVIGQLRDGVYL